METSNRIVKAATLLAFLAACLPACENTDITAPSGSTISLVASPAAVFIDQDGGQTSGKTNLTAQLISDSGNPVKGVKLFFSATGGLLGSVNNFCENGHCTRSSDSCSSDDQCPFVAQESIVTDQNGIAQDVLTLRLIQDPNSVTVTAQTTRVSQTLVVQKQINTGPADPVAKIDAIPSDGQLTGYSFGFSGANSTYDQNLVDIRCWEWTIDSDIAANDAVIRSPTASSISSQDIGSGVFDVDQNLLVRLRISDEPDIDCANPDETKFSPNTDLLNYEIRCDFTDPVVNAGPNVTKSAQGMSTVPVLLNNATASDPERPNLTYRWDCGNDTQTSEPGQTVTCIYPFDGTTQTYTATLTVENICGRVTLDSLLVTITP